jgi:flagellum-specific peptidoglycan hydrolase FlgJ
MKKFILILLVTLLFLTMPKTVQAAEKASGSSATLIATSPMPVVDKRVKILRAYLEQANSPLAASAERFVQSADENDLDWKLVAAIAGLESGYGKHMPTNSYNAWGWGVYGDNVIRFASFDEGIQTISKGLKKNYIDRGATDVYAIGRIYAASPTWAQRVTSIMNRIDAYATSDPSYYLSLSL